MSNKAVANLYSIFINPVRIFRRIKRNSLGAWLPFILIVGSSFLVLTWYFLTIDLRQFIEVIMLTMDQTPSASELNLLVKAEFLIRIASVLITCAALLVAYVIITAYFLIAGKVITTERVNFNQWFAFVFWANLPTLGSIFAILISYTSVYPDFMPLHSLDSTSFARLFGLSDQDVFFNVFSTITPGTVWAYCLYCVGFKVLTHCKTSTAIGVGGILGLIHVGLLLLATRAG